MARFTNKSWDSQPTPTALILSLGIVAVLITLGGVVTSLSLSLSILISAASAGAMSAEVLSTAACLFIGGWAGGCVLWSLGYLVRNAYEVSSRPAPETIISNPEPAQHIGSTTQINQVVAAQTELLARIAGEVAQIKGNLLLTADQREAKLLAWQSDLAGVVEKALQDAVKTGDFAPAELALATLGNNIPEYPQLDVLTERLEYLRDQKVSDKIESTITKARELISAGKGSEAAMLAEKLSYQFPNSKSVSELLKTIRNEAAHYQDQQVNKLYQQVEAYAHKRQWALALDAARELIEDYPNTESAIIVEERIPTLTDNARIEEVRRLRDEIRQHISNQQFSLAYTLAVQVVSKFPETAAANELRDQLPRLKERAKG